MTLQEIPSESFRERSIPVLETERLVLRAPRLGDAKAVAVLANDRRIAENTARIPHPYRIGRRRGLHRHGQSRQRNRIRDHAAQRHADRRLRLHAGRPASAGDRLLARRQALGQGLRHRSRARDDRPRLHRPRLRGAPVGGARHQSGVAARAGEVRLPVDRRGPARASARSRARRRSTASGSTAACGRR